MKIRILKAGRDSFWYAKHIGEIFEVTEEENPRYAGLTMVERPSGTGLGSVDYCDYEIIQDAPVKHDKVSSIKPHIRELLCQRCEREYPVWTAPNAFWNATVRDGEHFFCPTCFMILAEERKVVITSVWHVLPDESKEHLCPCLVAERPCQPNCTCVKPMMSHGCFCCARYGSVEQRRQRANAIVAKMSSYKRIRKT